MAKNLRTGKSSESARTLAVAVARLAEERNAEDVVVLDLRDRSPITDYFVIATGTSDRQMRALADECQSLGKKIDQPVWHIAGQETGDWVVMDFVDVVAHLFNESLRTYYDLELIWGEAPRVEWRRDGRP